MKLNKFLRVSVIVVSILMVAFIVSLILGFLHGDCGVGAVEDQAACLDEKHLIFVAMMAVGIILSAWAAYRDWFEND